jgi:hypothetical protein
MGSGVEQAEWRAIGVQQSRGWVHYAIHRPEPHIMLFRRPLNYQQNQQQPNAAAVQPVDMKAWSTLLWLVRVLVSFSNLVILLRQLETSSCSCVEVLTSLWELLNLCGMCSLLLFSYLLHSYLHYLLGADEGSWGWWQLVSEADGLILCDTHNFTKLWLDSFLSGFVLVWLEFAPFVWSLLCVFVEFSLQSHGYCFQRAIEGVWLLPTITMWVVIAEPFPRGSMEPWGDFW